MLEQASTTKKIRASMVQPLEHKIQLHDAQIDAGTKIEEVLSASYWSHFAIKARPFDLIFCRTDDNAWSAMLRVVSVGEKWVRVYPMLYCDMRKDTMSAPLMESLYEVKLRGPKRWSIIRKSDREIVKEDISTEREAWLEVKALEKETRE